MTGALGNVLGNVLDSVITGVFIVVVCALAGQRLEIVKMDRPWWRRLRRAK